MQLYLLIHSCVVFRCEKEALQGESETASLKPALNIGGGIEDALGTGDLKDFTGAEVTLRLSQVIEMGGVLRFLLHHSPVSNSNNMGK